MIPSLQNDGRLYTIARVLEGLFGALRALIVPKILGPSSYALIHLFSMLSFFAPLLEGGILSGLQKKISAQLPENLQELHSDLEILSWQSSALKFYLWVSFFASLLLGSLLVWGNSFLEKIAQHLSQHQLSIPEEQLQTLLFWGVLFYSVILFLNAFELYATFWLNAHLLFRSLATLTLLKTLVHTGVILSLVWSFKIYAIWFGLLLSALAVFLYLFYRLPWKSIVNIPLQLSQVKTLIRNGFPITLLGLFTQILLMIDRLMLYFYYPHLDEMGYYVLGLSFANYLLIIPATVSSQYFPLLYRETAKPQGERELSPYFLTPFLKIWTGALFLVAWAYLLLPELIFLILPQWEPGIASARLLIWVTCFYGSIQLGVPLFAGQQKERWIYAHQIPAILFAILSNALVLSWGYGALGVGATTLLTSALYTYTLLTTGYYECKGHFKGYFRFVVWTLFLLLYIAGASFFVEWWLPAQKASVMALLGSLCLKTFFYFLLLAPLGWKLQKSPAQFRRFEKI
jgi:O-antigen/teichoic acid export membrane protein